LPYKMVHSEDKNTVCVHKENEDGSVGEKKHCYTGSDAEEKAKQYMKALYAAEGKEMSVDFLFAELSGTKPFDGMASGKFTDFSGRSVEIKAEDLPAIVEKTKLAIASTVTEGGEVVGLPIDEDGHNHKGGAGWIVDVEMDAGGKKIRFVPKWTEIGMRLIKENIRRFFSVSVDLANKVVLGGSLTNWPATRNADGQILLRPIELSTELFRLEEKNMDTNFVKTGFQKIAEDIQNFIASLKGDGETRKGEQEMTLPSQPAPVAEVPNPTLTELLKTPEAIQELGKMAFGGDAEENIVGGNGDGVNEAARIHGVNADVEDNRLSFINSVCGTVVQHPLIEVFFAPNANRGIGS